MKYNWNYKIKKLTKDEIIFKDNMRKIFYLRKAFEDYNKVNKNESYLFNHINYILNQLEKYEEILTLEEKIKISNELIEDYNKLLDEIGRENFEFYDKDDDYIEYDLRSNMDHKSQFERNMIKILNLGLAFENYCDDNKIMLDLLIKNWNAEEELRENKGILTEKEKIKRTKEILDNYNKLLDVVGREHFLFDEEDDYYIQYKWDFNTKQEE